jgi:hypothetical protein
MDMNATQDTSEQITLNYKKNTRVIETTTHMVKGCDRHDFEQNVIALVDRLYPRNIVIDIQDNNIVWVM